MNHELTDYSRELADAIRARRSADVRRGMRRKAERGGYPYCAPLGYRNRRDDLGQAYIEPDLDTAPFVREAFEMAAQGMSLQKILNAMTARGLRSRPGKRLGPSALLGVLTNEVYLGRTRLGGSSWRASHGPIVEPGVFEAVQAGLRARKRSPGRCFRPRPPCLPGWP